MFARVTTAFRGVEKGEIYPRAFKPGEVISGGLAEAMVADGKAEEIDEAETKALGAAPENKAEAAAPENKAAGGDGGADQDAATFQDSAPMVGGARGRRRSKRAESDE